MNKPTKNKPMQFCLFKPKNLQFSFAVFVALFSICLLTNPALSQALKLNDLEYF